MKHYKKYPFSASERLAIVQEYETSDQSMNAICQKYGIKSHTLLVKWRKDFAESSKTSTFVPSSITNDAEESSMKEKTTEELQRELAALKKQLEWTHLQNKALNTLIDIAEEQGMKIRKKSGAKQ